MKTRDFDTPPRLERLTRLFATVSVVAAALVLQAQTPTNTPAADSSTWSEQFSRARAQYKDFKVESIDAFRRVVEYHDALVREGNLTHRFRTRAGQLIHCIEVHSQASLQRAGLAPGQLRFAPEVLPAETAPANSQPNADLSMFGMDGSLDAEGNTRLCPKGSIPKWIPSLEDLCRFRNLQERSSKSPPPQAEGRADERQLRSVTRAGEEPPGSFQPGHEHAVVSRAVDNTGAMADFNIWHPNMWGRGEFSLLQLWVVRGLMTSPDYQSVETGWQVWYNKYGDLEPHLFIYFTTHAYNESYPQGYNLEGGYFVQVNSSVIIAGALSAVSVYDGSQYAIGLRFYRDAGGNHDWWLQCYGTWIGYYPNSLFDSAGIADKADQVMYGGEVMVENYGGLHSTTEMGSGHFPCEGWQHSAFVKKMGYVNMGNVYCPATSLTRTISPAGNCAFYDIQTNSSSDPNWANYIYVGGSHSTPCTNTAITLKSATYSVAETAGTVQIVVSRTGGACGAATVSYTTADGTATAGSDYTAPLDGMLNWPDGDTSDRYIDVPITADNVAESSETFTVSLIEVLGGTPVGSPSVATATIIDGPPNDACSGAIALNENAYCSQNTTGVLDDGVSACLGRTMFKSVWFTYTPAHTGTATVDTCPSSFDTLLEVFTGTCGGLTTVGCNDDGSLCGALSTRSWVSFPCTAGTTYYICAGGYSGAYGDLQIRARLTSLGLQGTAILGTESSGGIDTPVAFGGAMANVNDADFSTFSSTWNDAGTDPSSYVGILWSQPQATPVRRLQFTVATFFDGGWFGPNNLGPGAGGVLTSAHLREPSVQVTADGGASWQTVPHTSDYLTMLNGHALPLIPYFPPTFATATFLLNPPPTAINGIRLLGREGGTASGGFLGVFEVAAYNLVDTDADGMDDDWERAHGLIVGINDGAADADGDRLVNLQEFFHSTNPHAVDTDDDGYSDSAEVQTGSNPTDSVLLPNNLARRIDATGIMGTTDTAGGIGTPVFHMGTGANIHDGDLTTRVDTWNETGTDSLSYVGILWSSPQDSSIRCLRLDLATFADGGWFGPNNLYPGAAGLLAPAYLAEPVIQVTYNSGVTWTPVAHSSDYLTALNGHQISTSGWNPTLATAFFRLNSAASGVTGIRLVGTEGGIASGGFLGVFELAPLTKTPVKLINPKAVMIGPVPPKVPGLQFEFDSDAGVTYEVQLNPGFAPEQWITVGTTQRTEFGRISVVEPVYPQSDSTYFRVIAR